MLIQDIIQDPKQFTAVEKCIIVYVLEHREKINKQSARYMAKQIGTNPSSIVRFCQKLGYQGFEDFKEAYIKEIDYMSSHFQEIDPNFPFTSKDKNIILANKMGVLYHETIDDILSLLTHDDLQCAIQYINKAENIYLYGAGVQNEIAHNFKNKLLKIGKNINIETSNEEAFYRASYVKKDSLFILLSYSGETKSVLKLARCLNERKVPLLALTSYGGNTLSSLASHVLYLSSREKLILNVGSFATSISTMFLLDILYAAIFNEDYKTNYTNKNAVLTSFETYRISSNPNLNDRNT